MLDLGKVSWGKTFPNRWVNFPSCSDEKHKTCNRIHWLDCDNVCRSLLGQENSSCCNSWWGRGKEEKSYEAWNLLMLGPGEHVSYINKSIFQAFPLCIFLTSLQLAAGSLVSILFKTEGFLVTAPYFQRHLSPQPPKSVVEERAGPDWPWSPTFFSWYI